jgi:hypothetical protein
VKDGSICWEIEAPALMAFLDDIEMGRARTTRSPGEHRTAFEIVKARFGVQQTSGRRPVHTRKQLQYTDRARRSLSGICQR